VIHDDSSPFGISEQPAFFNEVVQLKPDSDRSPAGDLIAFSYARNGSMTNTMDLVIPTFDATGQSQTTIVFDDLPSFPDPSVNKTGVGVDDQGRVTVVYTELQMAAPARVVGQRFDGLTGLPLDSLLPITDDGHAAPDVALLDPAGNRLIVPTSDFATVRGNIVDFSGGTPVILPEFPISTSPALFANLAPVVAADQNTGAFMAVWENLSGLQGDPVNIRGRRFDALGNPVGDDFLVNTTTANAQGQAEIAMGRSGSTAVVWAGDSGIIGDELDVFLQVYDADGNPIGGEINVNTFTPEIQDQPTVRFLPENDDQGREQFVVQWRDVSTNDIPRGTGVGYKCFSIDGLAGPPEVPSLPTASSPATLPLGPVPTPSAQLQRPGPTKARSSS